MRPLHLAVCVLPLAALASQPLPEGWFLADQANDFTAGSVDGGCDHPRAIILESKGATSRHATVMQLFQAEAFRGQRLRFSATLATRDVKGWAGLWMRVDGSDAHRPLAFDNMQDRPLRGSRDCTEVSVVLDVASGSETIAAGVVLEGEGHVVLSGVRFEPAAPGVETTDLLRRGIALGASGKNPEELPNEPISAKGRIGLGDTGGAWFNDFGVEGMGVVLHRRNPARWGDAFNDTLATLKGDELSVKIWEYSGDFTFRHEGAALLISGTWGSRIKYPVSIRLTREQLDMSWGFYQRHLRRSDAPQTDPRCARFIERSRGGDQLYVCGAALEANAPPVQTTVAFLLNGFRRWSQTVRGD